ncbi:PREDICTED: uncharacterized protein LOC104749819 [Camelina sativa]|uniref:Uncharacterized protein LOC104749819 n=1 Tax=Camelina sativa TaxID=90675 RepID=A0ABM0WE86_CAMSA|nr:PREDICTED: uncharacterized protein LOC104749819 [Camelina sativa]
MVFRPSLLDGYSFHRRFGLNPWFEHWLCISDTLVPYYPLLKLCQDLLSLNRLRRCDDGHRSHLPRVEHCCSDPSQGGCQSFLCCDLFVLVGVWSIVAKPVNDILISISRSLVPIISTWSSRGLLGSSILCSLEWSELYPCQGQPISSVRMFSLLSSKLEYDPSICLILKLTPFVPNCHTSPTDKKLGLLS